jgi:UDP-N-acetyl-D-mannosaminuronic acid dehydrogenase
LQNNSYDVVVVGGFGHVGLPLAILLAVRGLRVCALDVRADAQSAIMRGEMPFKEDGCEPLLRQALDAGRFSTSLDPAAVSQAGVVIVVIGTPVDRHLNPEFESMLALLDSLYPHLVDGQLLILRSTVYPGTTDMLRRHLRERGKNVELGYCPERIAEGHAVEELGSLPQIVSSYTPDGVRRCSELFAVLGAEIVVVSPLEAELAKLFNNTWRYTLFATANQFYMLANDHGADFYRIHHAMTHNYPRANGLPRPGFAAGPCLFKDAMQLAAFNNNRFYLGHAAMLVNEGLPNYIVERLKLRYDISKMSVGILGMAFKAESDDTRESLSFKLLKVLEFESKTVYCSDEYVRDPRFVTVDELMVKSEVIIVGAPHRAYRELFMPADKIVVDIWNIWGNGCVL